jgi:glycosyltransferase involved in cell wall biosynthesis
MRDLLVSIVIPTLNRPSLTARAFRSAISQSHKELEVLIVDNGSNESNIAEMTALGLQFLHSPTPGAGAARKTGLDAARGEFVFFLDSDDILTPNAIWELLRVLEVGVDGAFGAMRNYNTSKHKVLHGDTVFMSPMASNTLLRREVFTKFGAFSDDNYSWPAWMLRSQAAGLKLASSDTLVAIRSIHGENFSMSEDSMAFYFREIRRKLNKSS